MADLIEEIQELLKENDFEFDHDHENGNLLITKPLVVNPADLRTKVSELLSRNGFQGYYLKECYYYQGSKKPHRTDENGCLELEEGLSFDRLRPKKIKPKIVEGVKVEPLGD